MKARLTPWLVLFLLLLAWASDARGQIIVPPNGSGFRGVPIDVGITIQDLGDLTPPSLRAFQLDLTFDPLILDFVGVAFGDPVLGDQLDLSGLGTLSSIQGLAPGVLRFSEQSLDPASVLDNLQAGSFTLFTVTFNPLSVGVSPLIASNITLEDAAGNPLPVTTIPGSVTIVPEPGTLDLALIGLALLVLVARRVTGGDQTMGATP